MNVQKWLAANTAPLAGRRVALTGATGGLGRELCFYLAGLGAELILLDRSREKAQALDAALRAAFPAVSIRRIFVELTDMDSVRAACTALAPLHPQVLILNAGAYAIPRHRSTAGYDDVFQIDFVSPYYMVRALLPAMPDGGRVVAVGSIAHRYSVSDPADVDFSTRRACSKVYGNAKRYLMAGLYALFRGQTRVTLAVVHPGVTFTNITAHYPKWLFALIRRPMQWIFMPPRVAVLSLLRGVFCPCGDREWIGPWLLDVWGRPRRSRLRSLPPDECRRIGETAERIWQQLQPAAAPVKTE